LRLDKSQYLDVEQVFGYALYNFLFEDFRQAFHSLRMVHFELVHVFAYLSYVPNGAPGYASICLCMFGVSMNVYIAVYAI
jgi:hypothetical protein